MCAKRIVRHNIYVIGEAVPEIIGNKLPSKRQVLKVLYYNLRESKLTLSESASLAIKEVSSFWEKARLPVQRKHRCKERLIKLYNKLRSLQKNRNRAHNKEKEKEFSLALDNLFDIAHGDVMKMVDDERRLFLLKQRENCQMDFIKDMKTVENAETKFPIHKEKTDSFKTQKNNKPKFAELASSNGSSISTRARKRTSSNSNRVKDYDKPIFMRNQLDTGAQEPKKLCENTNGSNEGLGSVSDKCTLRSYRKNKNKV